jgi:3-deoxy-7-phosphoheptulonate synthase
LVHGRSITDSCLAWETTLPIFATLAEAVKARRTKK